MYPNDCDQLEQLRRQRRVEHLRRLGPRAMAADDPNISSATLILRDGSIAFRDAGLMRRGGRA